MLDQREAQRVQVKPVIRYWTKEQSTMISQVHNLSEKGIRFNTGKEYQKDTPVYIQMRSANKYNEAIFFKAKIKNQKKDNSGLFQTGAEIVEFMEEKDEDRLKNYINFSKNLLN